MIRSFLPPHAIRVGVLLVCFSSFWMAGCGGHSTHAVIVSPATSQVRAGNTLQFTVEVIGLGEAGVSAVQPVAPSIPGGLQDAKAQVRAAKASGVTSGSSSSAGSEVTWSVNGVVGGNATVGTIDNQGLYSAPAVIPTTASITVTATSTVNGLVSGEAAVSLENPIPAVQGAQPNPLTVGTFTLTVSGSKFAKGAQVLLNGTILPTTFVSATQLTASGTATQAEVGKGMIAVKNPDPGSVVSPTGFSLQIDGPLTIAVKVSPATAQIRDGGSQQFSAAVNGSSNTAVTWSVNGVAGGSNSTGTISATGLYMAPASLPNPNTVKVAATSMADSRAVDSATATLEYPIPTLTSVSPQTIDVGNFKITLNGTNFFSGAAVVFGGQLLPTTFVSGTQLTATGTATTQQVGQVQVTVQNPDPGSADSNAFAELVSTVQDQVSAGVAARFLEQASWGPTPATIAQVQQSGLQGYLTQQFSAPVSTYKTPGPNDSLTMVQNQLFANATKGQDQLRQRVSFALNEIMVISGLKIGDPTAFSLWMNMLQNDAFGNYSTLLQDVTLSPGMGNYLDMGNNDGCSSCRPNENYARESMQLFSIGLVLLNPDGTPQLDGSGNQIPAYTQATVDGFAGVYTGWSYPPAPGNTAQFYAGPYFSGPMLPYDSHHNKSSKLLLNGVTIPAGGTIQSDLDAALENVFTHPNVGPFISQQLIQKLVTSNPSPAYVSRVTQVFNDNGSGVRGDLKAVVSAILLDPEARRGDDPTQVQSSDGHLREPVLHIAAVLRAFNATTDGANLNYYAQNMGQQPFMASSVFNFYPPNYQIPGTQLLGPEFKIFNSSTDIARINFVNDLVYGSVSSTTTTNISAYVGVASDVNKLLDMVSLNMLHSQMSDGMRSTLVTTLSSISDPKRRTMAALYLTAGSSQFQVEH
jgi:uncharacterized protein (DUF1800 family)